MAYERSLVKKLKGLPVQILGFNLDEDVAETRQRCIKEGISWPSIHKDWKSLEKTIPSFGSIPQFYLVDAEGNLQFEIAGGGSKFEVEFMTQVEVLLANMGHDIELVDRLSLEDSNYSPPSVEIQKEILRLLKSNKRFDNESLKQIAVKRKVKLNALIPSRNSLAIQINHPQAPKFAREFTEFKNAKALEAVASDCYEFSQSFELGTELSEACLEISLRAVEIDTSADTLHTCARWLAHFPDRINEAIDMQIEAVQKKKNELELLVKKEKEKKDKEADENAPKSYQERRLRQELELFETFLNELEAE